jgi:hypothetical protein
VTESRHDLRQLLESVAPLVRDQDTQMPRLALEHLSCVTPSILGDGPFPEQTTPSPHEAKGEAAILARCSMNRIVRSGRDRVVTPQRRPMSSFYEGDCEYD